MSDLRLNKEQQATLRDAADALDEFADYAGSVTAHEYADALRAMLPGPKYYASGGRVDGKGYWVFTAPYDLDAETRARLGKQVCDLLNAEEERR